MPKNPDTAIALVAAILIAASALAAVAVLGLVAQGLFWLCDRPQTYMTCCVVAAVTWVLVGAVRSR